MWSADNCQCLARDPAQQSKPPQYGPSVHFPHRAPPSMLVRLPDGPNGPSWAARQFVLGATYGSSVSVTRVIRRSSPSLRSTGFLYIFLIAHPQVSLLCPHNMDLLVVSLNKRGSKASNPSQQSKSTHNRPPVDLLHLAPPLSECLARTSIQSARMFVNLPIGRFRVAPRGCLRTSRRERPAAPHIEHFPGRDPTAALISGRRTRVPGLYARTNVWG